MTSSSTRQATCVLCRHVSPATHLESTHSIGSPDLDLRPPEASRSSIAHWIQRCPRCGYCAPDIERNELQSAARIDDSLYVNTLEDSDFPPKAREFLCWSLIAARTGRFNVAAWARINAAWVCDDAGATFSAVACRALAIDSVEIAERSGQALATQPGADAAIAADLLRRCGRFDEARLRIHPALSSASDQTVREILHYQLTLCDAGDRDCHTIAQAVPPEPLDDPDAALPAAFAELRRRRQSAAREEAIQSEARSPRRFLQELASQSVVGKHGCVFPTIAQLPGVPLLKSYMAMDFKAYGWPEPVATLSFALALARALPNHGEIAQDILDLWTTTCAGYEDIVEFLYPSLRGCQPLHWAYTAPPESSGPPPTYGDQNP